MDKQIVLVETKKALSSAIESITLENVDSLKKQILEYIEFIEALSRLSVIAPIIEKHTIDSLLASNEPYQEAAPFVAVSIEQEQTTEAPTPSNKVYKFERKLRGGLFPDLDNGYLIPERMVRELNIEHGDWLEITETKMVRGLVRHWFRISEKGSGEPVDGRSEVKYCILEKAFGEFVVRRTINGEDLKVNGIPYTFIIKSTDVFDFSLQIGDIIDIAFYRNNPNETVKSIWKHDTDKVPTQVLFKPSLHKKSETKIEPIEKETIVTDPGVFEGKNILVIGAEPKTANYRTMLDKLGATMELLTGRETKSRLRSSIKKSDAVIIVIAHLGHGGSKAAVEICKTYKKPFEIVDNMGNQSFLLGAEKALYITS